MMVGLCSLFAVYYLLCISFVERDIAGAMWKRAAFLQMLKSGLGRNPGEEGKTAPSKQVASRICLVRGFDSAGSWSR